MTARRAEIAASLAERGRPENWATEDEAAALSGVSPGTYRAKLAEWEKRGFPQANTENGKRSIPAILAFWGLPQNHSGVAGATAPMTDEDEDGQERWTGSGAHRRAS